MYLLAAARIVPPYLLAYPDLFNRAATLEENAMPYLKTVKGLGRSYSWKEQFGKE